MQEPGPIPTPERSDGSSPTPEQAAGPVWHQGDSPTVHSGSAARRARITPTAAPYPPLPVAGCRIESFELEEAIGVGGMGAVFRAHDSRLDRQVALKILPPEQAHDPEVVQRFYQEGRAAARLDNENIARVFTIGHDGSYHFIAFEYIEGTTIRQRVERNGPLPNGEAINYTLQIAGALVHASERGVVHRDIKPSNIIVTPHGRAKLVDMGLARRFERGGDDGLTQSGMTLGTFDYISPEQARDPRDVDVRSDLYSLGCTLFHMLTGRPPFPEGTVLQKLIQHQENAPPDIRALNPEVPPDLANILNKLMAKDRDRRYQTPEQLVRDLLTVAGALGLRSVSPEGLVWMSAAVAPAWQRHLVWGIPTLALLLVVVGLVVVGQDVAGPARRPGTEPEGTVFKVETPPAAPTRAPQPRASAGTSAPTATATATVATATATGTVPAPPRDLAVDSSEDLLAVLAAAPPRSIIVLVDAGPYLLGAGRSASTPLIRPDLTLKADAGVHPVLRLARDPAAASDKGPAAILHILGGRLTVEGLEFVLDASDRDATFAALRAEDTDLIVRRCVFRRNGARTRRGRLAALQVRASPSSDRGPAVLVEACHVDGGQVGILASGPVDVLLRDCTLAATEPAAWFENAKPGGAVAAELRLRHDSLIAGDGPVFRFEGTPPRVAIDDTVVAPARDGDATLVAADQPDTLDWRGRSNLYGRIGVYLQGGSRATRDPIRDWSVWEEGLDGLRETGSASVKARPWDDADPLQALAQDAQNPTRVFRLAAARPGGADLGVRQGPFGTLAPPPRLVASARETRPRGDSAEPPALEPPARTNPVEEPMPAAPPTPTPTPTPTAAATATVAPMPVRTGEMPEMPVMPPAERDDSATRPTDDSTPSRTETATVKPKTNEGEPSAPPLLTAGTDHAPVLRTADQFLNALSQAGSRGGTLRIAADADWELPAARLQGTGRWVLRAEPGGTRPKIRFHPGPADPKAPVAWLTWIDLRAGSLQLEGIDLVLPASDAPAQGRWAAFSVGSGTDLSLTHCTVTVEGEQAVSAVLAVQASDHAEAAGAPEPSAARVRIADSLLRAGGDLVDVAGAGRLVLELDNAVVSTGGTLVHGHGVPRNESAGPIEVALRQVTVRSAGGIVLLDSAPGEPELPVADINVRETILATTARDLPLFRVDGQDALGALRDRIKWEGHGVAYHQINAYRRDQTALLGTVPKNYDRSSWTVAVGTKDTAAIHGDAKFLQDWTDGRPAWSVRRDDFQLAPDTPAGSAGPELARLPTAP